MNFIGMRNFILDGGENLWEIGKSFFHAQAACALHLLRVCMLVMDIKVLQTIFL